MPAGTEKKYLNTDHFKNILKMFAFWPIKSTTGDNFTVISSFILCVGKLWLTCFKGLDIL